MPPPRHEYTFRFALITHAGFQFSAQCIHTQTLFGGNIHMIALFTSGFATEVNLVMHRQAGNVCGQTRQNGLVFGISRLGIVH